MNKLILIITLSLVVSQQVMALSYPEPKEPPSPPPPVVCDEISNLLDLCGKNTNSEIITNDFIDSVRSLLYFQEFSDYELGMIARKLIVLGVEQTSKNNILKSRLEFYQPYESNGFFSQVVIYDQLGDKYNLTIEKFRFGGDEPAVQMRKGQ